VAAGFEHSIANMYLLPLGMLVQSAGEATGASAITLSGVAANLAFVTAGNLLGGSVLVGLAYHFIYGRRERSLGIPGAEASSAE
jgi:formate/nitrite transporter FocA (FNT family)